MNKSSLASMPDLTDKVVLITGGEGGIGQGLVRVFATAGASVVIHYLSSSKVAEELASELRSQGHSVATAGGDICSPEDCQRIVADCVAAFGKLDCLVNNAGVQPLQELESMTLAQWNQVVEINLNGTFNMTQAAAAVMKSQGGGSIINIASVEASLPAPNHAHYTASKAAVKMFARGATLEYARFGIRVNSVSPGLIDRGDLDQAWPEGRDSWLAKCPLRRVGTPVDVAYACVFLASDMASWASGIDLTFDGGMSAVPAW